MPSQSNSLGTFSISNGIFVIGMFETGVTVYSQQVRALNLAHALIEASLDMERPASVAVIGAGISGLTVAAALLVKRPDWHINLFERRTDLCPLQQGSDSRWLHPHIYDWPKPGSRNPSAALPVMNWREGRASDVADTILRQWGDVSQQSNVKVFVDAKYLRINAARREVEWIGHEVSKQNTQSTGTTGDRRQFDFIIIATGFGEETGPSEFPTISYWRNETFSQPRLDDRLQRFVVSGFGDGALIDLFRLRIERFRQDRIVEDLFGCDQNLDRELYETFRQAKTAGELFNNLSSLESTILALPLSKLSQRLRKDTQVFLHVSPNSGIHRLSDVLKHKASYLNRILLFLLYKCGGFTPIFEDLNVTVERLGVDPGSVICRHGTNAKIMFAKIFEDYWYLKPGIHIRKLRRQEVDIQWDAGYWNEVAK